MTEMQRLAVMLISAKIPFQVSECYGAPRICYPDVEEVECDVVCHEISAGGKYGLLEIAISNDEDEVLIEGYLSAENAFEYICDLREGV